MKKKNKKLKNLSKDHASRLEKLKLNRKISREIAIETGTYKIKSNTFDDRTKYKRSRQKKFDQNILTSF